MRFSMRVAVATALLASITLPTFGGQELEKFLSELGKEVVKEVVRKLTVDQTKVEQATEKVQPEKKTPKFIRKLKGLTLTIEYPFLIEDKFLTSAAHLIGTDINLEKIDISDLVRMTIKNETKSRISGLKATAKVAIYSEAAIETVDLAPGESATLRLNPVFNDSLAEIIEQKPGSIYVSLAGRSGKLIHEGTKRITLLSRNDAILSFPPLLGVFITPNDKRIDELNSYAAEKLNGRTMAGYQGDSAAVSQEIQAIYDTIAEMGLHYRSATLTFFDAKDLIPQRTYFPAESLEATGANCLDGTLLFASALENIGIESALTFIKGHVFIGARLQPTSNEWMFIETTMVGHSSFADAVNRAKDEYSENSAPGKLAAVYVKSMRELKVKPFPSRVETKGFSLKDKSAGSAQKIYDIKLESAYVTPQDLRGQPPSLFVSIEQNGREILSTRGTERWVASNNPNVLMFETQDFTKRIILTKADELKLRIYQEGTTFSLTWTLTWQQFVSRNFNMSSPTGSGLRIAVKEIH